jgi:glycosyltransferase involved in cell wall biosynthesis
MLTAASLSSVDMTCANSRPQRKPRLLLLAHFFPPAGAIASVRTWNAAKRLARANWDVTVVTPHPSIWRYAENAASIDALVKHERIRRILTGHGWRCLMPELNGPDRGVARLAGGLCRMTARRFDVDKGIGWIKAAEQACAGLRAEDVDIILASGPPFAGFSLARRLADRLGRPYVLDYRDPWTEGNGRDVRVDRPAAHRLEARLLESCAAVTTVSQSKAQALDRDFRVGDKVRVVTNGYDPEELGGVQPHDFGHFAIVYAGIFYPPKRVISPIMAAVKRLGEIGSKKDFCFHYYGDYESHVREEAERFGVTQKVVLHGRVPRSQALSAERGAGAAVVITSVFDQAPLRDKGIVPGKIFELVGLNAPTLLISPPGSDAETILKSAGLGQAFQGGDVEGIARFLSDLMSGRIGRSKNTDQYSWDNVGIRLDRVLREVLNTIEC